MLAAYLYSTVGDKHQKEITKRNMISTDTEAVTPATDEQDSVYNKQHFTGCESYFSKSTSTT